MQSMAGGNVKPAFSDSRQPGNKDDVSGDDTPVPPHMAVGALYRAAGTLFRCLILYRNGL